MTTERRLPPHPSRFNSHFDKRKNAKTVRTPAIDSPVSGSSVPPTSFHPKMGFAFGRKRYSIVPHPGACGINCQQMMAAGGAGQAKPSIKNIPKSSMFQRSRSAYIGPVSRLEIVDNFNGIFCLFLSPLLTLCTIL